MHLSTVAARNLQRRPARTLLTIAGIATAAATVVALVGLAESLESSFLSLYNRRGADLVVQRRGGAVQLSKGLPLALAARIRTFPETREVIAGLMDMVSFEDHGLFMVIVNGWEPDCPVFDRVTLLAGRRLQAGDRNRVMLGRILAANLEKKPGDSIELYGRPSEVVGIFESFSVYENGAAFLLIDELQRQMDRPGQATGFVVQASPPGDRAVIDVLRRKIEACDPAIEATPCAQFVSSLAQMRATRAMAWVASSVACAIAAIGVFNTMAMSVLERRNEIGALRALGWRKSLVVRMILMEAALLGSAGAAAGALLGSAAGVALSWWPATSCLVQGDWSPSAVFLACCLSLGMSVGGALAPALRCVWTAPRDALQAR